MDWEKFRRDDGSINLLDAWYEVHKGEIMFNYASAAQFLLLVEKYQKINSRQVAALALAHADIILFDQVFK